jgi:hypothetical protein
VPEAPERSSAALAACNHYQLVAITMVTPWLFRMLPWV